MSMDDVPSHCSEEGGKSSQRPCIPDGDITAFTITDEVLDKLSTKSAKERKAIKKQTKGTWMVFQKQEELWRSKENCIDNQHARKTGMDPESINRLETNIGMHLKCPCAGGAPLVECYDKNTNSPLHCRQLVRDYIRCINAYRQSLNE